VFTLACKLGDSPDIEAADRTVLTHSLAWFEKHRKAKDPTDGGTYHLCVGSHPLARVQMARIEITGHGTTLDGCRARHARRDSFESIMRGGKGRSNSRSDRVGSFRLESVADARQSQRSDEPAQTIRNIRAVRE
jgi:hypothetical protein